MNAPQRNRNNQRRRPQGRRPAAADIWRNPGALPEIEPISLAIEPGALIRSLGDPPMLDGSSVTYTFTVIIERAAALAAALALSVDLLVDPTDD